MSAVPTDRTPLRHPAVLWFGILGPPLAWTTQLVLGYAFEEAACSSGSESQTVWGASPELLIALLTGVTAAVAALGLAASLQTLRASRRSPADDPRGRFAFMGFAGALSSGVFLLVICFATVFLVGLDSCVQG